MVVASTMAKNGENEKALYYIDKALKAEPRLHTAYNLRGVVFLNMKKRFEAFKNFESAIQLNKFSPEPHYNLGLFYWEENNLDKAVEYFTNAIEVKNDYAEAHNYLGVVLIRKGKLHEGISQFEKALQINPNYKNAQMNLQHALRIKKNKNHGITG